MKPLTEFDPTYNFRDKLLDILEKTNDTSIWESPEVTFTRPGHRFNTEKIMEWFDFEKEYARMFASNPTAMMTIKKVKIYPYKKEGLQFDLEGYESHRTTSPFKPYVVEYKKTIHVIKACKDGFHRDWNLDGICVSDATDEWGNKLVKK